MATDGALWGVGSAGAGRGCALALPDNSSNSTEALIVAYSEAGVARVGWRILDFNPGVGVGIVFGDIIRSRGSHWRGFTPRRSR